MIAVPGQDIGGTSYSAGAGSAVSLSPRHRIGFMDRIQVFVLIAYVGAIIFLPRIHGNLRYEDLITPLLALAIFIALRTSLNRRSVLFGGLYFSYTLVITLLNIAVDTIPLEAIIIFGKEFQYFLGFLVMLAVAQEYTYIKWVRRTFWIGALFAGLTGLWMLVTGQKGYYGISYITEMDSPSLSALMYFNLAVLALILRSDSPSVFFRGSLLFLSMLLFGMLLMVGSRTGFMMGGTFFLVLWISSVRRPILLLLFLAAVAGVVASMLYSKINYLGEMILLFQTDDNVTSGSISRLATMFLDDSTLADSRFDAWGILFTLATENAQGVIFGCGRGCGHVYLADIHDGFPLGLSGDSQYLVTFLEGGLIGIVLFAAMLFFLARGVQVRYRPIYLPYLSAYLVGGIFVELFLLSKGGGFFWLISAMVIGSQGVRGVERPRSIDLSNETGASLNQKKQKF